MCNNDTTIEYVTMNNESQKKKDNSPKTPLISSNTPALLLLPASIIDARPRIPTSPFRMVLAEVPLWVSHGNATASTNGNGVRTLSEMGFAEPSNPTLRSTAASGDQSSAKLALSLLSSTRGMGRAPMYSIDVHPDGTRFASAGGDGTVKIWSMSCLFGGKFSRGEEKRRKRADVASSRFLQDGNYVSSNTENYLDDSSSSSGEEVERGSRASSVNQQGRPPLGSNQAGVNDLSGLVRKKNGSKITARPGSGDGGSSQPPMSTSTQTTGAISAANAIASTVGVNNINDDVSDTAHLNHPTSDHHKAKNHKLLCTIPSHDGSVLSLRFSPSGIYLATAGDDSCVKIFVRSATPSLVKGNMNGGGGSGGGDDIEHWNRIALCRGHHLDVVGLAWAPDDSYLVSCSLDSVHPIIVWRLFDVLRNTNDEGEIPIGGVVSSAFKNSSPVPVHYLQPHKILGRNVHTSTVKGVSFDPSGKYLASSGDDPAICIWRAFDDWGLEARIDADSGIFRSKKRKRQSAVDHGASTNNSAIVEEEDDPGELASLSLFRRISFAPDGSHVCATNATLRGKNIAAMISREGWMASGPQDGKILLPGAANLVGHKQPVVASRHCPVFFAVPTESGEDDDDDSDAEPEYATLVALGDKRGFVTIWST
jgi:protein HIRA/HIR1